MSETGDSDIHKLFADLAAEHCEELVDSGLDLTPLNSLRGFGVIMMKVAASKMADFRAETKMQKSFYSFLREEANATKAAIAKFKSFINSKTPCGHCKA